MLRSRVTIGRSGRWRPLLLGALMLASCNGVTAPSQADTRDLSNALRQWLLTAPPSYELTMTVKCFCPPDITRPVRVTVRDGSVVSRHYADDGTPYLSRFTPPTVDELFEVISRATQAGAHVEATYDPTYGHPRAVFIDGSPRVADDETWYALSPLRPL